MGTTKQPPGQTRSSGGRARYPPELRHELVQLVKAGYTPAELAKRYAPSAKTIRRWYQEAALADTGAHDAEDAAEAGLEAASERGETAEAATEVGEREVEVEAEGGGAQSATQAAIQLERGLALAAEGDELYDEDALEEAAAIYREALECLDAALAAGEGDDTVRREWGVTLERFGDALFELQGASVARSCYEGWCELAEAIAAEHRTPEAMRDWSVALGRLGQAVLVDEGPEAALPYYQETAELREVIARERQSAEAYEDWSLSLERYGAVQEAVEGLAASIETYRQAMELREALAEQHETAEAWHALGVAQERLAMATLAAEGAEAALPQFQALSEIFTELAEAVGTEDADAERRQANTMLGKVQMAVMEEEEEEEGESPAS